MRPLEYTAQGYAFHDWKLLLIHHKKLDLWLPVGGHIEPGETPDDCVVREFKQETFLDIKLIEMSDITMDPLQQRICATPFYTDVHSVGDHDHYGMNFICIALNPEELRINNELKASDWFDKRQVLDDPRLMPSIRRQAEDAFHIYRMYMINRKTDKD